MNANIMLACAFPPSRGLHGACTTLADLSWGRPDPVFCPTKRSAVNLVLLANMERGLARGKGMKAAKRAARAEEVALTRRRDEFGLTFGPALRRMQLQRQHQLDAELTEQYAESRSLSHHQRVNIHE